MLPAPALQKLSLARALPGVGDELCEGLHRQAGVHDEHVGLAAQDGDVVEVLDGVVAQVGLHERIGQVAALRGDHERVAVGLGAGHELRPIDPPAPGLLSITMGTPRMRPSGSAYCRAITSTEPPGGKGTTSVIGRAG